MPVPIPAIQHRKAVLALTILTVALDKIQPDARGKLLEQCKRTRKWLTACGELVHLNGGRLSSGARRDIDAAIDVLAPYVNDIPETQSREERLARWAAIFHCGLAEEYGVWATCPLFGSERTWKYLDKAAESLADLLSQTFAGCDEAGANIALQLP